MLKDYPKIDVHCHTTNRPLAHTVDSDATLNAIARHAREHNVMWTLLLATYFPRKGTGITNFRMRNWIDSRNQDHNAFDRFIMFGSLDFEHYYKQGLNELEEMADRKMIHGVKVYAGYQDIDPEKLRRVLELCRQYKLPVMAHTGDCIGTRGAYGDIRGWDGLVEKFHDLNFLYSHLCNPFLDYIIERVKRYPNVFTDISGLIHSGKESDKLDDAVEYVKKFYDSCGIGQLMFGTDFPVQTHADSVYIARQALQNRITDDEARLFYYDTASRLLRLPN